MRTEQLLSQHETLLQELKAVEALLQRSLHPELTSFLASTITGEPTLKASDLYRATRAAFPQLSLPDRKVHRTLIGLGYRKLKRNDAMYWVKPPTGAST